ncbi:MAG: CHAD domain-containing protein [Verrucomicrobia bacterium]|jgi:CHAD domain-containing protein|nr:CHAD domain-containing protein [Verrucomicrobiota bacterium]
MAFHFKRGEGVAVGIHRLLQEQVDCSIQRFAECIHPGDSVHAVRKNIKKIRAILTLVRPHFESKAYRRETEILREISKLLAPVRDTQVHLQTLKSLAAHLRIKRGDKSFAAIEHLLEMECRKVRKIFFSTHEDRKATKLLKAAKKGIAGLKIVKQKGDWKLLSHGIRDTYKCGKKGLLTGQEEGGAEEFHEWRKSVKRLWYQMRLLSPAWPVVIQALNDELGRLGEDLGIDHDLFVLRTIIEELPASALSVKQREYLFRLIAKRQGELRREALSLGKRIYYESPAQFCKRVGQYWEAWRGDLECV